MFIIRHEIHEFVLTWNAHRIRTRPDLVNNVSGIPDRLYYRPNKGIENCGKISDLFTDNLCEFLLIILILFQFLTYWFFSFSFNLKCLD
jgi:hypothetical protein